MAILPIPSTSDCILPKQGLADKFAILNVLQHFGELDGILTFCEMAVPLVARLAEHFGLPGNTPQSVDDARDKHATRRVMQASLWHTGHWHSMLQACMQAMIQQTWYWVLLCAMTCGLGC